MIDLCVFVMGAAACVVLAAAGLPLIACLIVAAALGALVGALTP